MSIKTKKHYLCSQLSLANILELHRCTEPVSGDAMTSGSQVRNAINLLWRQIWWHVWRAVKTTDQVAVLFANLSTIKHCLFSNSQFLFYRSNQNMTLYYVFVATNNYEYLKRNMYWYNFNLALSLMVVSGVINFVRVLLDYDIMLLTNITYLGVPPCTLRAPTPPQLSLWPRPLNPPPPTPD